MFVCFCSILTDLIENSNFVPKVAVNSYRKKSFPKRIRRLAQGKLFLYKKYVDNGYSDEDRDAYRLKCKSYKLAVKSLIRDRELAVLDAKKDRKFFAFIRSKQSCRPAIPIINDNGNLLLSDASKATCFSNYFASVFSRDNGVPPPQRLSTIASTLRSCSFAPETIYAVLLDLPAKISSGPDDIPPIFLRNLAVVLSYPLSVIFEKSFATGEVPSLWRQANVTPIHKKASASLVSNYRPISMTSVICKVFETIVREKITTHLRNNSILSKVQHGFVSRKSTVTQLLLALNEWTYALDSRQFVDIAYLDYKSAFDSVVHSKLAVVLTQLGIEGNIHRWIVNYLKDRTQRVRINQSFSESQTVLSSVPQGTCLGPLLFIMYINELPKIVENTSLFLFADDCKLHICYKRGAPTNGLQTDLDKIFLWSESMQLKLALSKCSILHLGRRPPNLKIDYELDHIKLDSADVMRDLGVMVDSELKFSQHCATIVKKASMRMNCIFQSFETRDTQFLLQMFKTYVRPTLEYASSCWSPYLAKDIKIVESVQRSFTKRIPELARLNLSYIDRLNKLNLERLDMRRLHHDLILAYKLMYGHLDVDPNSLLLFHPQAYNNYVGPLTATKVLRLRKPNFKLHCRRNFFGIRVVDLWNELPNDVKLSKSTKEFKSKLTGKTTGRKVDLSAFLRPLV